jgi:1-acyl-sn-glycerol-3-phosphate acyltransferase
VKQQIGRAALRLTGWDVDGAPPDDRKYVAIAAPHTSNWDLLYLLLHGWYHGVTMSWLAKDSLFVGPVGWVLRALGGIPVARGQRGGLVGTLSEAFEREDQLIVVIPPAGTRSWSDHWKSGFYRVAMAADVPIVCCYLDYGKRIGGFGPRICASGDSEADLAIIRRFYSDKRGKYPDQASVIALQEQVSENEEG